ncbi:ACT domain-containing protein [Rhodobacter sp. Har01]|uniref:ACT domain-containing protein n=1 Tax=Rhodobacter sp. Har01 TaxID=2883999 RepID=UPI001D086AA3|nr:ACT domain-containing protein [Rhodobacter sp. Har01]MCB6178389.1 ACT domain-containing protein [Rhodobacter sp. Har01]
MTGERDLGRLLAGMRPELSAMDWGFACADRVPEAVQPFAVVAEDEGLTLVAPMDRLRQAGLQPQGPMARITLRVHSSLVAVGLTAAVAGALAAEGISANVIAGFHHDHIFLPAAQARQAMQVLDRLSRNA